MLTPLLNSSLPQFQGRLLVLLCSYRGGIGNPPPFSWARIAPRLGVVARLLDRVSLLSLRQFIASNRDFFANVRSMEYQVALLNEALGLGEPSEVIVRVDQALAEEINRTGLVLPGLIEVRPARDLVTADESADNIVIIYPDALGLGWGKLESSLTVDRVYVVNGRRRIFALDAAARSSLRWRRMLANTRVPELLASLGVIPLAAGLAVWDAMRGKS